MSPEQPEDQAVDLTVLPPTVNFVVIRPTGELEVLTADNLTVLDDDQEAPPYQASLWQAVRREVAVGDTLVTGAPLEHALRVKMVDVSEQAAPAVHDIYPPNTTAWTLLTLLGHKARKWIGTVVIVAEEDDNGITPSLSEEQLAIITAAHERARVRVR